MPEDDSEVMKTHRRYLPSSGKTYLDNPACCKRLREIEAMVRSNPEMCHLQEVLIRSMSLYLLWHEQMEARISRGIGGTIANEERRWGRSLGKLAEQVHRITYGEQYTINIEGLAGFAQQVARIVRESLESCMALDDITRRRLQSEIGAGILALVGRKGEEEGDEYAGRLSLAGGGEYGVYEGLDDEDIEDSAEDGEYEDG